MGTNRWCSAPGEWETRRGGSQYLQSSGWGSAGWGVLRGPGAKTYPVNAQRMAARRVGGQREGRATAAVAAALLAGAAWREESGRGSRRADVLDCSWCCACGRVLGGSATTRYDVQWTCRRD